MTVVLCDHTLLRMLLNRRQQNRKLFCGVLLSAPAAADADLWRHARYNRNLCVCVC